MPGLTSSARRTRVDVSCEKLVKLSEIDGDQTMTEEKDPSADGVADSLADEERKTLERIIEGTPERVLVVSDLHLGSGRDETTGAFDARENFLSDGAFARWLSKSAEETSQALLVLNGDTFDFVRIRKCPTDSKGFSSWRTLLKAIGGPEELAEPGSISAGEMDYGLRTHDYKTVWKLLVMARGHGVFFQALADWVGCGNSVVFVTGNHDLELHWPLVRTAIRYQLKQRNVDAAGSRVAFAGDQLVLENLFFEHGHRHEAVTRVVGEPVLEEQPDQINLPLGSFVNRYYVNHLERLDPFIDNIKPVYSAVLHILRRRPLSIATIYLKSVKFIPRAIKMKQPLTVLVGLGLFALLAVPFVAAAVLLTDSWRNALLGLLGGGLFVGLAPYLLGVSSEIGRALGIETSSYEKRVGLGLSGAPPSSASGRIYAVVGHTHDHGIRVFEHEGVEAFYLNTGTWIPVWPDARKDLTGRIVFSFARFDRTSAGGYRHELLEWDDQAVEARSARVFHAEGWGGSMLNGSSQSCRPTASRRLAPPEAHRKSRSKPQASEVACP